jgi:hypothetical protein
VLVVYSGRNHYDALVTRESQVYAGSTASHSADRYGQPKHDHHVEDDNACLLM